MTPKKLAVLATVVPLIGITLGVIASQMDSPERELQVIRSDTVPGESSTTRTIVRTENATEKVLPLGPVPIPSEQPADEPLEPEDFDVDDDGVSDETDNCVDTPNADQSDFDADGTGDLCDADDDNDNLSDNAESGYNTNPYKKDTDGDGWWDGNEVNKGTDPLDPNDHPEYVFPGPGDLKYEEI